MVDAYNVLYDLWGREGRGGRSLEDGRLDLLRRLQDYVAFAGVDLFLVYDGSAKSRGQETYGRLQVVYTKKGETADSYIERLAYELLAKDLQVCVVTSDYEEQKNVFGSGALRLSSREFYQLLAASKSKQGAFLRDKGGRHNHLDGRIDDRVLRVFQKLRKG